MTLAYTTWLGLKVRLTNIDVQKINNSTLKTYKMVIAGFSVYDKLDRVWFFKENFLLANISIEIVLKIPLFSLSNANVEFTEARGLIWRTYTVVEAIPIIQRIELIDKHNFIKVTLNKNSEIFVLHVLPLKASGMMIHSFQTAQIAAL